MKATEKRYCFFCDGPTDQVEPHHCPLTFGIERTYTLEELIKEKQNISDRRHTTPPTSTIEYEADGYEIDCSQCGMRPDEEQLQHCYNVNCPHK